MPRNRWPSRPLEERFWEKVEKGPDCWVWIGAVSTPGWHGRIWVAEERRKVIASRVSWEMHRGPIPAGMMVLHHCDNPPCVNPDHLFLGTNRDNLRDASAKGRTGPQIRDWSICVKGLHPMVEGNLRRDKSTGRRHCAECARATQRRHYATLTPEQKLAMSRRWRKPSTPEQRARRAEVMRHSRARRKVIGQTPTALRGAADKLGEAMG